MVINLKMRKKNAGLGRGLDAIFLENSLENTTAGGENIITILKLSMIDPKSDQPRKYFDKEALEELSESIKENGLLQPILVREYGNGRYQIIAGERRFRASKIAGLSEIPAIILDKDDRKVAEIALIENIQREDLNPIEAATAMKQLMDDYGLTQEELSERIGKSRSAVANTLRLLSLDGEVIKMVSDGKLSQGHARALVTLPSEAQKKIAKKSIGDGLSVRDIEQEVKNYFNPPAEKKRIDKLKREADQSAELKDLIARMQQTLGTKVQAIGNDKKGRIYIDYYTRDDLDRLSEILEFVKKNKK